MGDKIDEYALTKFDIEKAFTYADEDMNFVNGDEDFYRFFGSERTYQSIFRVVEADDVPALKQALADIDKKGTVYFNTKMKRVDGAKRSVALKISLLADKNDVGCKYTVEMIDTENSHNYIAELELECAKYKSVLSDFNSRLFEYDPSTDEFTVFSIRFASKEVIFSAKLDDIMSSKQSDDTSEEDAAELMLFCNALKNSEIYIENTFSKNPFTDEGENGCVFRGSRIALHDGRVLSAGSITSSGKDFTYAANINDLDMMTGLLNKRAILDIARTSVEKEKYKQVFLVMIDLDNFKLVNDTYGHMMGDEVIKKAANIIKTAVGSHGWVGRFGGDEFFAVMHDLGAEGDLRAVLRTIFNDMENCYKDKFEGFNISCSMGIAEYPRNGTNYELLFKKADRGVYIAKKKGKKRYIIYKEDIHGDIDLNSKNEDYVLDTQQFAGDIKSYKLMRDNIARLATEGTSAIDGFINGIIEAYNLNGISLYAGEDFKLVKQWGSYTRPMESADYLKHSMGLMRFNSKDIFWENNVESNGFFVPIINNRLLEHLIYSTVQCMIHCDGRLAALMTFDMEQCRRNWTEEDTHFFGIVAQTVGSMLI